jgi:hypothetical protein
MALEDKKALLKKGADFNRENSENIRFNPNIPVTVVFTEDWHKHFKQETQQRQDNPEEEYVTNLFMVQNPNSEDPTRLRRLRASQKLYEQISDVLQASMEQGWNGPVIMKITKKVTGGNQYGTWSVHADKFQEGNNKK